MDKKWTEYDIRQATWLYQNDRSLQIEFSTLESYLAYREAEACGWFKVWNGRRESRV